jgi:hypothetical protein
VHEGRRGSRPVVGLRVLLSVLLPVLLVPALVGCDVGLPREVGPRGVDGLVVPTPSPDPDDFAEEIDNPWLPLVPGSTWRYRVTAGGEVEETVTVTVTDQVREVAGVTATVVRDVVTDADGEVVEDTRDWFAQDVEGNVWYLGEDTVSFEDGRPSSEGSWEAGVDGAEAGLAMPAVPRVGDGYRQEWAAGEAEDQARVLALDASRATPYGGWDDLLQTEDTTPLEPDVLEHKFYARGVGLVLEENPGDDEVVELVSFSAGP